MLFNILFVILVVYVCISPYFYAKAVKFGIKLADKPSETAELPFFNIPKHKEKPKMTPEEYRTAQIMANIGRYDGTSRGQVEIKRQEA